MRIWMLVDREPGFAEITIGDRLTAWTEWRGQEGIPDEIVSKNLDVIVTRSDDGYWLIRDPSGLPFAALLGDSKSEWAPGPAKMSGCVEFDRYMHYVYTDEAPSTTGTVVGLGVLQGTWPIRPDGSTRFVPALPGVQSTSQCSPEPGAELAYYCVELEVGRHRE
ncbi:hypothetical protein R1CP_19125 [Rhodococcus opacus]|uniref:Uncharacterized protein n=1 Tax=Rhodococcus opacus TaxID=37919 RepID=A0A1B1K7F7_RHOOP|nr:hypothetical protein R1CP_19125 [Rhodococcus opacus]